MHETVFSLRSVGMMDKQGHLLSELFALLD